METTIDKIFHHFAFTIFWVLVIAILITTLMRVIQWDNQSIKECIDRGYSEAICRGL